ncbi:MAG TPA: VWA domain-containing protein, partial [Edaphobacter sp.]|nr:VWA domain-containing protein [Edaphobacter sp.]
MMTSHSERTATKLFLLFGALLFALPVVPAQTDTQQPNAQQQQQPDTGDTGPAINNGPLIIRKKPESAEPPPPAAPAEPKVKNPGGANYSLRVDVPMVNLNVNVILDKTHQFVPGLKPANFLVLEDGVPQTLTSVRTTQAPITAVMLLEFAANSYYYIYDMENAAFTFFQTLKPDDYIAVVTYDLKTHILTDFTNNKDVIAQALQSLVIPTFSDTDMFDALYETLDRLTRVDGR